MLPKHDFSKYPYSSKLFLQALELNGIKRPVFMNASVIDLQSTLFNPNLL